MKPLGRKAYGSIGHLPDSRMGPSDHHVHQGQAKICTEKARDYKDTVVVQEKLDGSCCSVAMLDDGSIVALVRRGYTATSSPYHMHHLFDKWVQQNEKRFNRLLDPGERCVGEWLIQSHSTMYKLPHEPFVVFDIMRGNDRIVYMDLLKRATANDFITPNLISYGLPIGVKDVMKRLKTSGHGATDEVEGAVWRVERDGKTEFLAKYVRPDKIDGIYLPSITGKSEIWNEWPIGTGP